MVAMPDKLTGIEDWDEYHHRDLSTIRLQAYFLKLLEDYVWSQTGKGFFELGCGSSQFLYKTALKGFTVSGIDFHQVSLNSLQKQLERAEVSIDKLLIGDVTTFDVKALENRYDILFSAGFLEHFQKPVFLLDRWRTILKENGKAVSIVPNMFSLNAEIMKQHDPELYKQHIRITPSELDDMHLDAGFSVVVSAFYYGGYDINFLIPWEKLQEKMPLFCFKALRYFGSFCAVPIMSIFWKKDSPRLNPIIIGVYQNAAAPIRSAQAF